MLNLYLRILSILFITLSATNLFSQLSPYHGVLYPYDSNNKFIHSAGSLTYSLPDYSLDIQNNPVCLFFIEQSQVFTSISQEISEIDISSYKIASKNSNQIFKLPRRDNFYPGYYSGTLVTNIYKRRFIMATVIKKVHSSGYDDIWLKNKRLTELMFLHERSGNVWIWSLGFGYQLTSDVNIAFSYSRWFGDWRWYDKTEWETVSGEGKFDYDGQVFNLGILKRFRKLSISGIIHSPLVLMKSNEISIEWWGDINKHNIKQSFAGSFKIGISYQLSNRLSIASGYRLQGHITIKNHEKLNRLYGIFENERENIYGNSHQISLGSEYLIKFGKREIPISFAYWVNWLPKKLDKERFFDDVSYGYRSYSVDNQNNPSNNVALGINVPISAFNIHFNCQWNSNAIIVYNRTSPPDSPTPTGYDSYNVKNSNFVFNLGVSFIF